MRVIRTSLDVKRDLLETQEHASNQRVERVLSKAAISRLELFYFGGFFRAIAFGFGRTGPIREAVFSPNPYDAKRSFIVCLGAMGLRVEL